MPAPSPADDLSVVLDAAAACYLRLGVSKTTASNIAAAAGISRATLYRRFGSHETIFLAVLERESAAMAAEAAGHLAGVADPADRLVESMIFSIRQITTRPVHAAIFTGDSAAWAAGRAFRMEALRRIGEAAIRPLLRPATETGGLSGEQVGDLVDWILRILLSYAAIPGPAGRTESDIRRQLTALFLPGFASALRAR
jgi:AcrR family transcriptional regulator